MKKFYLSVLFIGALLPVKGKDLPGLSVLEEPVQVKKDNSTDIKIDIRKSLAAEGENFTIEDASEFISEICGLMWRQYPETSLNQFNGEAYINSRINDGMGPDHHIGISELTWGADNLVGDWGESTPFDLVWMYCYNIIENVNCLLPDLETVQGSVAKRDFIKAQALTMRAHAYTKLMQFYAPRWENSDDGTVLCVFKRINAGEPGEWASMNEIFNLIYADLDEAISLYNSSGLEREAKNMTDRSVAYGIYARAAMIIHDYSTAKQMAHNAAEGYRIMDNDTYLSGFNADNNDLMWASSDDPNIIYYWSEYNHKACNGYYVRNWAISDGIDIELYRQLNPDDIRTQCYFMPDKIDYVKNNLSSNYLKFNVSEDNFWNADFIKYTDNCNIDDDYTIKVDNYYGLNRVAVLYSFLYKTRIFKGDLELMNYDWFDYYIPTFNGDTSLPSKSENKANLFWGVCFGAQYKFWGIPPYFTGNYPFMRSTEMKLLEAETSYYLGDLANALEILNEINSLRIPGYEFTETGESLLNEIRLCRRIELWGEGHNWTDFKRWNLPVIRKEWQKNNPASGNWAVGYGVDTPVDANNGWRLNIPKNELEDNGIFEIDNDSNGSSRYYNLQGIEVKNPAKGQMLIEKKGNKTRKVIF